MNFFADSSLASREIDRGFYFGEVDVSGSTKGASNRLIANTVKLCQPGASTSTEKRLLAWDELIAEIGVLFTAFVEAGFGDPSE